MYLTHMDFIARRRGELQSSRRAVPGKVPRGSLPRPVLTGCTTRSKAISTRSIAGSSRSTDGAVATLLARQGVCRDFAHLAISFCRALNIPARYVVGYIPEIDVPLPAEPMDFAAWMEVWLGDRWWTFDPRNNQQRKGRVVIGRGRDASDVAMVTAFGQPWLSSMSVIAEEIRPR